jgi:hypothetical protein
MHRTRRSNIRRLRSKILPLRSNILLRNSIRPLRNNIRRGNTRRSNILHNLTRHSRTLRLEDTCRWTPCN